MSSLAHRLLAGAATPQWRVDQTNPLARGLVRYLRPQGGNLYDHVTGKFATKVGDPLPATTPDGAAQRTNGVAGANYWSVPIRSETADFTIYMRATVHAHQSGSGGIFFRNGGTNTFLGIATSPRNLYYRALSTNSITSAYVVDLEVPQSVALTRTGANSTLFVGGAASVSATNGGTGNNSAAWNIGRNGTSAQSADMSISAVLIWDRVLSADEIRQLESEWRALIAPPFDFRALLKTPVPGAGDTLSPARATHAQPADGASLTSIAILAIADSGHGQTADTVSATAIALLAAANAGHSHGAEAAVLLLPGLIAAAGATHALNSDVPLLTALATLAASETRHIVAGRAAGLTPSGTIQPSGRLIALASDGRVAIPEGDLRRTDISLS